MILTPQQKKKLRDWFFKEHTHVINEGDLPKICTVPYDMFESFLSKLEEMQPETPTTPGGYIFENHFYSEKQKIEAITGGEPERDFKPVYFSKPETVQVSDEEIEKAAHNFVDFTTIYGEKYAEYGSRGRSYYETELRCYIDGAKEMRSKLQPNK